MASRTIDVVTEAQAGVLDPGESFVAAGRAECPSVGGIGLIGGLAAATANTMERKDRERRGAPMREHMIWAVTNRRLLIWEADRLTTKKPKTFLDSFVLGEETFGPAMKRRRRDSWLFVRLAGEKVSVKMPTPDADEVFAVLQAVLPPPPSS